ncbi:hypothetical protein ACFWNL_13990 [Kitasatospora sp. NPDC058397]|uniref:hypothetical protein n=1 Tax=unclassified Kitasatospora TaxID=2633591 RepID=UPI003669F210
MPAETVHARFSHWATVEQVDADSCRLLLSTDSLDWPAMMLGALQTDFRVVRPPNF